MFESSLFSLHVQYSLMRPCCALGPSRFFHIFGRCCWIMSKSQNELNVGFRVLLVGWLFFLGLTALWDCISVYIKPSSRDREIEFDRGVGSSWGGVEMGRRCYYLNSLLWTLRPVFLIGKTPTSPPSSAVLECWSGILTRTFWSPFWNPSFTDRP